MNVVYFVKVLDSGKMTLSATIWIDSEIEGVSRNLESTKSCLVGRLDCPST